MPEPWKKLGMSEEAYGDMKKHLRELYPGITDKQIAEAVENGTIKYCNPYLDYSEPLPAPPPILSNSQAYVKAAQFVASILAKEPLDELMALYDDLRMEPCAYLQDAVDNNSEYDWTIGGVPRCDFIRDCVSLVIMTEVENRKRKESKNV